MRRQLSEIFQAGLERVDPYRMITRHLRVEGDRLVVAMEGYHLEVPLGDYRRILLLGAGKASGPMARAVEEILGDRIESGLVCVKYGHTVDLRRAEMVEAGHPVPDRNGVDAARRIAALARAADAQTLVINCISGGGSALLPFPMDGATSGGLVELSLDDKQCTTSALLRCGADIQEINCVRKHISGIKGGRLLQMLQPARSLNLILSDVVGDDLGSIASGMTTFDATSYAQALEIVDRYRLRTEIPAQVLRALELGAQGRIPETVKAGASCLERVDNVMIGTNRQALLAAAAKAASLGFEVRALTSQLAGEARHAAKVIADIAKDVVVSDMLAAKPACLLLGGETVVTLRGNGKGGRNQEMALAFLDELKTWGEGRRRVFFLAASTDGNDGPTDAAGAFADEEVLRQTWALEGDCLANALNNNDSYHFFEKTGGLFKTGPTNTNVCDLQIAIII
ncbi:glycerate kinase type-2 family protein [Desulfuromonas versatilis]|nr:glycerate kinase [Desulfuromonas versatilis]